MRLYLLLPSSNQNQRSFIKSKGRPLHDTTPNSGLTFRCSDPIAAPLLTGRHIEQLHDSVQEPVDDLKPRVLVVINSTEVPVVSCTYV